jgi:hypothetical protein
MQRQHLALRTGIAVFATVVVAGLILALADGGRFELQGTGNSAHRIAASSNGGVGLIAGGGQLSLLLVEFAGLDLAESLGLLIGKDIPVEIR